MKSGWNWFDLLVVTIGMMSMFKLTEGPLTMLRNLRAFRVFRLFKRVKSLNKILQALVRATPGVANSFGVILLVMCIYAILGVEFFQNVRRPLEAVAGRAARSARPPRGVRARRSWA